MDETSDDTSDDCFSAPLYKIYGIIKFKRKNDLNKFRNKTL